MRRLRDHLNGESRKVTEWQEYSNAWGNAQDTGKGHRGRWTTPNGCGGCRVSPIQVEPHPWRAGCREIGLSGSGRGGGSTCRKATRWPPTSSMKCKVTGVNRFYGIFVAPLPRKYVCSSCFVPMYCLQETPLPTFHSEFA